MFTSVPIQTALPTSNYSDRTWDICLLYYVKNHAIFISYKKQTKHKNSYIKKQNKHSLAFIYLYRTSCDCMYVMCIQVLIFLLLFHSFFFFFFYFCFLFVCFVLPSASLWGIYSETCSHPLQYTFHSLSRSFTSLVLQNISCLTTEAEQNPILDIS